MSDIKMVDNLERRIKTPAPRTLFFEKIQDICRALDAPIRAEPLQAQFYGLTFFRTGAMNIELLLPLADSIIENWKIGTFEQIMLIKNSEDYS